MSWLPLLFAILCTEAVVECLQSRIFDWVRGLFTGDGYVAYFVRCPFCQSFWAALLFCVLLKVELGLGYWLLDYLISTLVVFRLSGFLHSIYCVVRMFGGGVEDV